MNNCLGKNISKISLFLAFSLTCSLSISCSNNNILGQPKNLSNQVVNISNNKNSISVKIQPKKNSFNTKKTQNGIVPYTYVEVKSYRVHLIKNPNAVFPAGADPLSSVVKTVDAKVDYESGAYITFNGLSGSGSDYYHIAVQAFDGWDSGNNQVSGNELIKENNGSSTPWSGAVKRIAVSTSGVQVSNDTLAVSSTTPLQVTPNLLDGKGVIIDIDVTPSGQTSRKIHKYSVNLAINPSQPYQTRVYENTFDVNRNYSQLSSTGTHKILIESPPDYSTYNATVEAFDINGNSLILDDNNGTAYTSPDNGKKIAVSSNRATVARNFTLSFNPSSPNRLTINANLRNYFIKTYSGNGTSGLSGDTLNYTDSSVQFASPTDITKDSLGNIYIVDSGNNIVRKINNSGIISTFVGLSAGLSSPNSVSTDNNGNVYISDTGNHRVLKVSSDGATINTFAGNGSPCPVSTTTCGDGSPLTDAQFNSPKGLFIDKGGNIYIADSGNNKIRKIDTSNNISTIVGTGSPNYSITEINNPTDVFVDEDSNIFIVDKNNNRIRMFDPSNPSVLTDIAGDGASTYTENAIAISTSLFSPSNITVDLWKNIYISEGARIKVINPNDKKISTFAGNGTSSYSGENIFATSGQFSSSGIFALSSGDILFADDANNRIRLLF